MGVLVSKKFFWFGLLAATAALSLHVLGIGEISKGVGLRAKAAADVWEAKSEGTRVDSEITLKIQAPEMRAQGSALSRSGLSKLGLGRMAAFLGLLMIVASNAKQEKARNDYTGVLLFLFALIQFI